MHITCEALTVPLYTIVYRAVSMIIEIRNQGKTCLDTLKKKNIEPQKIEKGNNYQYFNFFFKTSYTFKLSESKCSYPQTELSKTITLPFHLNFSDQWSIQCQMSEWNIPSQIPKLGDKSG